MDRNVLITGVLGGIGSATAKLFKEKGWNVIGVDRRDEGDREYIDDFYCFDISKGKEVEELSSQISSDFESMYALINNAAIQISKRLIDLTEEDWDSTYESNVKSIYLSSKYFYPLLKNAKASIINISSVHAVATSKNVAAYVSSKGAILALTRAMALEFAGDGIRVNAVLPGAVDTGMLHEGLPRGHISGATIKQLLNSLSNRHPLRRIGKPEEIAQMIYFLADTDKSSFITGQAFIVDGGATAQLSTEV